MTQPIHLDVAATPEFPYHIAMHLSWSSGEPRVRSITVSAVTNTPVNGTVLRHIAIQRLMNEAIAQYQRQHSRAV